MQTNWKRFKAPLALEFIVLTAARTGEVRLAELSG
jgi:hypothetical protein